MPVEDGCWLWTSHIQWQGYGRVWWNGKSRAAHRVVYQLLFGPITDETLDHLCRVRSCVNPAHLEPVSHAVNAGRGKPIHQTHCKRGHEFNTTNTYHKNNKRQCRVCRAMWDRSKRLK